MKRTCFGYLFMSLGLLCSLGLAMTACLAHPAPLIRLPPTPTSVAPPEPLEATATPSPTPTAAPSQDDVPMIRIPAGEFIAGTTFEAARKRTLKANSYPREPHQAFIPFDYIDEAPQRSLYLDEFYIDQFEVTQARYQRCLAAQTCDPPRHETAYDPIAYPDYPVTHVNWEQAAQYCQWAGKRLPTEMEWEKAARGTDGRLYPWGNEELEESIDDDTPSPVGSTPVDTSPYGVNDMAGSVGEWVRDWYLPYPDPNSSHEDYGYEFKVWRGGRLSQRNKSHPILASDNIGFRCVRGAPEPTREPTFTPSPTRTPDMARRDMIHIPAGEFIMGSDDPEMLDDVKPIHTVYLDAYYIDRCEVSYAEFMVFLTEIGGWEWNCGGEDCLGSGSKPSETSTGVYQSREEYADLPIDSASWQGAKAYCSHYGLRLPTEAEWEKAARGTDGRLYPWGNEWNIERLATPNEALLAPVCSNPSGASPYGVLNMAGNAAEHVFDWYDEGYYAISPLKNPLGPETGTHRVLRGFGSFWSQDGINARTSRRGKSSGAGFRCVADVPPPPTRTPTPTPTTTLTPSPTPRESEPITATPSMTPTVVPSQDDVPMIRIPAGEFIMGSTYEQSYEYHRQAEVYPSLISVPTIFANEVPQRTVYLDAFYIDQHEVSITRYKRCVEAGGCPSIGQWPDSDKAVELIWAQADSYCRWAGKRLPTEREWEKAARGTDGRLWPWGNEWQEAYGEVYVEPVGLPLYDVSPYGVMGMGSNVAEWTADDGQPYPGSRYEDEAYAQGSKVVRGGDGTQPVLGHNRRTAFRYPAVLDHPYNGTPRFGLRCVRGGPAPTPEPTYTPAPTNTPDIASRDMVLIPAGEFIMGSDDEKVDSAARPAHSVYLDAFSIDRCEVSQGQYVEFLNEIGGHHYYCGATNCAWTREDDTRYRNNYMRYENEQYTVETGFEDYPVERVSWYGAEAYCRHYGLRLPTEAEWEKAARGTDGRIYPWGNEWDVEKVGRPTSSSAPSPVCSTPQGASPYGVQDMAGNVAEWVNDWYDEEYYSVLPRENPFGPTAGVEKVSKGVISLGNGYGERLTGRFGSLPTLEDGFRCASD